LGFTVFLFLFSPAFLQKLLHDGFFAWLLFEAAAQRMDVFAICSGDNFFFRAAMSASVRRKFTDVNRRFDFTPRPSPGFATLSRSRGRGNVLRGVNPG
jgi:hypothetical protein